MSAASEPTIEARESRWPLSAPPKVRLDLANQPDAAIDQPGIELQQRGAGLDLGDGVAPELTPPTPISGKALSARTKVSASMRVDSLNSGRPDSPPSSRALSRSRSEPAARSWCCRRSCRRRGACARLPTTSSRSDSVRSGAILRAAASAGARRTFRARRSRGRADRRAPPPAAGRAGPACSARTR